MHREFAINVNFLLEMVRICLRMTSLVQTWYHTVSIMIYTVFQLNSILRIVLFYIEYVLDISLINVPFDSKAILSCLSIKLKYCYYISVRSNVYLIEILGKFKYKIICP